jgi:hypothetical protein
MVHGPREDRRGELSLPVSTVYVAERLLSGVEPAELAAIQRTLADAARRTTAGGQRVRYLRGTYLPAQGRLICVFDAESEEAVHASTWLAQLPFARVERAFEVPLSRVSHRKAAPFGEPPLSDGNGHPLHP